jgi:hypothetical protein
MPAASLRALLERFVDYAGLFPPATLPLEPALKNQAKYVRTDDAWMLGAFVLPIAQFKAAAALLGPFDKTHPLEVSALGSKTNDTESFVQAVDDAVAAIRAFTQAHGEVATVTQLEMPLPADIDVHALSAARDALEALPAFWEAPAASAESVIAVIAQHNATTSGARPFGFKLRTGGVTADAFPSSAQIAAVLVAGAQHRVPIKFTAGLHHPIRRFHASVQTKMHGFLNVLGAAVLGAEHAWDATQTSAMLNDEDASAFRFDDERFGWRDAAVTTDGIRARRELVTSLGSCSFDEPREDLRALKLL